MSMLHRCLAAVSLVGSLSCATTTSRQGLPTLPTVSQLDLQRYLGVWYEIAHFPEGHEEGCFGTTATYSLRPDGDIDVLNTCHKNSPIGPEDVAHGRARVVDPANPAKLEVSFFRPFWGDYWVFEVGSTYDYAVVGHPSRDHLWILSRTPQLAPATYDAVIKRLEAAGYETRRLLKTPHRTG